MGHQVVYGYPCVTDPNDFTPDPECSSPAEIAAHRTACANYGKPTYEPNKGCTSEYDASGQLVMHIARTSWGIGTNVLAACDGCGEPAFGARLITCHECGWADFCDVCWPEHERKHDEGLL